MQEKDSVSELEFLHSSSADDCNHGMKEIDIADQKGGSYRPDRFMRKIK